MEQHSWSIAWDIIGKIFVKEGREMTDRQFNIFKAIRDAYIAARKLRDLGKDYLDGSYEAMLTAANENKLSRIEDIAHFFFVAMFKFGGE